MVGIIGKWRNKHGEKAFDEIAIDIETTVHIRDLMACGWIGEGISFSGRHIFRCDSQEHAEIFMTRFKAIARFMEITGWKPSRAHRRFFGEFFYNPHVLGFDHTLLWSDVEKRVFATTEPYDDNESRDLRGMKPELFVTKKLPNEIGMWFPPDTKLFLVAKPNDLQCLERAHERIIAQWGCGE